MDGRWFLESSLILAGRALIPRQSLGVTVRNKPFGVDTGEGGIPCTGMEATSNIGGGHDSSLGGQAIICAKAASRGLWWYSPDVAI